jgi:hypothetical protein
MQFASCHRGSLLASILPGLAWLLALFGTTGECNMRIDNWNLKCPKCGDDNYLQIKIHVYGKLTPSGIEVSESVESVRQLQDATPCECAHSATLQDFTATE